MSRSLLEKQDLLRLDFSECKAPEALYRKIMAYGKKLPPYPSELKKADNLVEGCQSVMYLSAHFEEGKLFFYAASDALISAGLAAILIDLYSGETPETILLNPPSFLDKIGIPQSLTPGRANGLASLYLKMKQCALNCLITK